MATKTKSDKSAGTIENMAAIAGESEGTVKLSPLKLKTGIVTIVGTTPLIMHNWSEKAKEMMRCKQQKKGNQMRAVRDPKAEYEAAMHKMPDGSPGIPVAAIIGCMLNAAHKDIGVPKSTISKAIKIVNKENGLIPLISKSGPRMREDMVRVGMGSADLRYRPEFIDWKVELKMQYDSDIVSASTVVNLLQRAGFGVGLLEMRPEKGGDFGRFEVLAA